MALSTQNTPELTREQIVTILTQPLEQQSVFLAAGPTVFDTDGSPVRVPSAPALGTYSDPGDPDTFTPAEPDWIGENELITELDADLGELMLLPSTMKSVKVITRYSNELARQSIVSLDSALRSRLVADVAAKIDAQFLSESGDGVTTPRGIFAYADTQAVPALTGPLTPDAILDAQALALGANVDPSRLVLFVRPEDYMSMRGIKDADGRYLVEPDAQKGGTVVPILGADVRVSSRVPAGRAALVDMSQIAVARDMDPSVKVLTERYADYDQQAIRVVARYDSAPLHPEAVVTFSGITAE